MNSKEIVDYLKSEASEKYKENVIKMGIPEKFCIGVSTSTLKKFAKKLDKSNELAFELWNTHYHEARLLAVLIFDHKCLTYDQIDALMSEVSSWDLCDHLCKNLIVKLDFYEDFIFNWIAADHIYKKRASFVLIAASAIHDKWQNADHLVTAWCANAMTVAGKAASWWDTRKTATPSSIMTMPTPRRS